MPLKRANGVKETFDMVVLSVGLVSGKQNRELARALDIALDPHGFAATSDLSPVATTRPGIFTCGVFQGPKDIPQSVMGGVCGRSLGRGCPGPCPPHPDPDPAAAP